MTKLLFDNFELFLNAPNGIKKLRDLILQLAVQGKLVPQNPDDEPASELLKKIKAKKERLVKEKKIKMQKPLLTIEKDEIPFDLPEKWVFCRLGEIITFNYGKGVKKENLGGNIPAYGANGILKYVKEPLVIDNCIIVGRKGSAGVINKVDKPCWPLDVTYFINISNHLNYEFIYSLLLSKNLPELAYGIKPGLNRNDAYHLTMMLPPLPEQRRIVEKVDSLMSFCDELEKLKNERDKKRLSLNKASLNALLNSEDEEHFQKNWNHIVKNFDLLFSTPENVKELKQAILQLAVMGKLVPQNPDDEPASELLKKIKAEKERLIKEGKIKKQKPLPKITEDEIPFKLPGGWIWCRLGDAGIINPRNDAEDELEASFVPMRYIFSEYSKRITTETNSWGEIRKGFTHFAENDVSVAKITPCFENGKSAVMEGLENDIGAGTTELHIFRPVNSYVISRYVLIYFKTSNFIESGKTKMTGSAGQKRIPREYITNALFSLPPVKEQKRVVEKVDSLMVLCDELEKNLTQGTDKSEKLVNALVNDISNL